MYKLCKPYLGVPANCVEHVTSGTFIPMDPDNKDYQLYLKWLEEGNTPLPADEGTQQ